MSDDPMSSALLYIEELESRCEHLETDRNNLALEMDVLIKERDEARREVCFMQHLSGFLAGDFALSRGWNCFKDKANYDFPASVKEFRDSWCDYSNKLKNELDEVRALYCQKLSPADPQKIAEKWRWDCFDNGKNAWLLPEKCKDCMDKLAELDEELGLNE